MPFWRLQFYRLFLFFSSIDATVVDKLHYFLTDPGRWPIRILRSSSSEARRWPIFGFVRFTSYISYSVPWFPWIFACVVYIILYTLRDCSPVTILGRITNAEFLCLRIYISIVTFIGFHSYTLISLKLRHKKVNNPIFIILIKYKR